MKVYCAHGIRRQAVTFIELIITLLIIGIIAAVSVPRLGALDESKFKSAIKKIIADIQYVQRVAIARHADCRIEVDAAANSYRGCYCNESDGICDTGQCGSSNWTLIPDPLLRSGMQVNFTSDPVYRGIDIGTVSFGGTSTLRFDWEGIPQNLSRIRLTQDGTMIVSYKSRFSNTIRVTPNTGRVWAQ